MGNVHEGKGEIPLKKGVTLAQVQEALKKEECMYLYMHIDWRGTLHYEYDTKRPDYRVFELLKQFAAHSWTNFERSEMDDWRAPARSWMYDP